MSEEILGVFEPVLSEIEGLDGVFRGFPLVI
jgi:hypothetical protein